LFGLENSCSSGVNRISMQNRKTPEMTVPINPQNPRNDSSYQSDQERADKINLDNAYLDVHQVESMIAKKQQEEYLRLSDGSKEEIGKVRLIKKITP